MTDELNRNRVSVLRSNNFKLAGIQPPELIELKNYEIRFDYFFLLLVTQAGKTNDLSFFLPYAFCVVYG